MDRVCRASAAFECQPLEVAFDAVNGLGVEEIPELRLPEEIGEERTIERQGGGSSLRDRRVVVVHERRDEVERER